VSQKIIISIYTMEINIVLQIIIGFLLADIIGGGSHWFEDTYIHYCTQIPIINEIARYNEMHHYFPRTMLVHSYYENIKTSILFSFILFIILFLFLRNHMLKYPVIYICLFALLPLTNLFHRFSHQRDCETNSVILFLQKIGVLCNHEHHKEHHVSKVNTKYCTIFPITNYCLDTILFWRILEKIIGLFGILPDRKQKYEYYKPIQNYMHEDAKQDCPHHPTQPQVDILFQNLDNFIKC
jgi:hypothetical protein